MATFPISYKIYIEKNIIDEASLWNYIKML